MPSESANETFIPFAPVENMFTPTKRKISPDNIRCAPMENRKCFHGKNCAVRYVTKADSQFKDKWIFACGLPESCGFFAPQGSPIVEDCWCIDVARPSKLCKVMKDGDTKGMFFLACGVRRCDFMRWLPLKAQPE